MLWQLFRGISYIVRLNEGVERCRYSVDAQDVSVQAQTGAGLLITSNDQGYAPRENGRGGSFTEHVVFGTHTFC